MNEVRSDNAVYKLSMETNGKIKKSEKVALRRLGNPGLYFGSRSHTGNLINSDIQITSPHNFQVLSFDKYYLYA